MTNNPLLSIIIPVAPNRQQRLAAILSRLSLNQSVFPDHTFEVIVADGGSTDNTRELCETVSQYINLKYVYMPICRFINAAYPRNVMLRMCSGKVIGMLDIDHWPSENIIFGMLHPFIDDMEFRVILQEEKKIWESSDYLNGRVNPKKPDNVINRGYVIDSSKSSYCVNMDDPKAEEINAPLLHPNCSQKKILQVYDYFKIPKPGVNGTLWTWAILREHGLNMNGYDELYCRQFAYVREDDDWRERLLAKGLHFFDEQNVNFCAIHLWHRAAQRNQDINKLNRDRFNKVCNPVRQIERNINWQWGKLIKDSFSIINGQIRNTSEHENWISENIKDVPNYVSNPEWSSINEFMEKLEEYSK